jgi:hypothetical protein
MRKGRREQVKGEALARYLVADSIEERQGSLKAIRLGGK